MQQTAAILYMRLEQLQGPSQLPPSPKPTRARPVSKPRCTLARARGVEKKITLGMELLALLGGHQRNCTFGRAVRRQFDLDAQPCAEAKRAARIRHAV